MLARLQVDGAEGIVGAQDWLRAAIHISFPARVVDLAEDQVSFCQRVGREVDGIGAISCYIQGFASRYPVPCIYVPLQRLTPFYNHAAGWIEAGVLNTDERALLIGHCDSLMDQDGARQCPGVQVDVDLRVAVEDRHEFIPVQGHVLVADDVLGIHEIVQPRGAEARKPHRVPVAPVVGQLQRIPDAGHIENAVQQAGVGLPDIPHARSRVYAVVTGVGLEEFDDLRMLKAHCGVIVLQVGVGPHAEQVQGDERHSYWPHYLLSPAIAAQVEKRQTGRQEQQENDQAIDGAHCPLVDRRVLTLSGQDGVVTQGQADERYA